MIGQSLTVVVWIGVMLNGAMLITTLRRWFRFTPCVPPCDEKDLLKSDIGKLTLMRTLRIEAGFLACQLIRLLHTYYAKGTGDSDSLEFWGVLSRESMPLILVYLSVADLFTRKRIIGLLNRLNQESNIPK